MQATTLRLTGHGQKVIKQSENMLVNVEKEGVASVSAACSRVQQSWLRTDWEPWLEALADWQSRREEARLED